MGNIETWNNRIDLPKEFDWISNEKLFLDVMEFVKEWYWNNFTDTEKNEIKNIRNGWCVEFKDKSDDFKKAVIGNRIDKYLFEYRNKDYIDIDMWIIRKMNNASTQREFRKIALELKKRLNVSEFSEEELSVIESKFLEAKNAGTIPDIEKIIKLLNDWTIKYWIPGNEVFDIAKEVPIKLPWNNESFDIVKEVPVKPSWNIENIIINWNILPNDMSEWVKKKFEKMYNELNNKFKSIIDPEDQDAKQALLEACYQSINDWTNVVTCAYDKLATKNPTILWKIFWVIDVSDINDQELSRDNEDNLSDEDKKDTEYLSKILWNTYTPKQVKQFRIKYKKLAQKVKNKEQLTAKDNDDYIFLCALFWENWKWWLLRRLRNLEEIRDLQVTQASEFKPRRRNSSIEYATWNIKDIKPMAIIENNDQIKNYVYWKKEDREKISPNDINLSRDDKIKFFGKLKEQKKWDPIFSKNADYFNENLTIKEDLVNLGWINMESVIERQKEIERMVNELAVQENLEKQDKNKINEVNVRRSCMYCCFRAISKFFDTVNNNWENFASEFEIQDVNENIKFDGKVIAMEWTIWVNRNHVKLYYNTETWELFFDNFLAYDPVNWYQIWKWNWAKKKLEVKLPTMNEMENNAKSINLKLIDNISMNMNQYNRMVWFAMSESIRLNSFRWFMWDNLEANKLLIQRFNEENILKQDIIYTIYSKYYDDLDEKLDQWLQINEKTKPAQFKLIELISKSIDHYELDANQLLRFRNYINKLDNILATNHDVIEKDDLLRYLFVDNKNTKDDRVDTNKKILNNENPDRTVWNNDDIVTYKNYNDMVRFQKYPVEENQQLNYYTFLKLLSINEWADDIIDLNTFENTLNTIDKIMSTSNKLLDKKTWLLWENYNKMVGKWEIPDIISMWKEVSEVISSSKEETTDLQLDVNMNNA